MKKFILFALALLIGATVVEAKPKGKAPAGECIVRIGDIDIISAKSRRWSVDNGKTTALMNWKKCREAIADMFVECDCDIYTVQEADFPVREDLPRLLKKRGLKLGYFWAIPNPEATNEDQQLSNGIFFRKDRFKLSRKRTFFLSETPEEFSRGWGEKRWYRIAAACEVLDKKSGQKFFLMTTQISNRAVNSENSGALLIEREKMYNINELPSVLAGYFDSRPNAPLATILKGHYQDSYYKYSGKKSRGNYLSWSFDTKRLRSTNHRRSYIYVRDGKSSTCEVLSYEVHTKKYPVDGYDVYPSMVLPIITELKIK